MNNKIESSKALLKECEKDHPDREKIRNFISEGADPETVDEFGRTALHSFLLCLDPDVETTRLLCPVSKILMMQDKRGLTPLHCLCLDRIKIDLDVLKFLLDNGADPNTESNEDRINALQCLCLSGTPDIEAMKLLLAKKADPNHCAKFDGSSLYLLCKNEKSTLEAIQLLLENHADANIIFRAEGSPLHILFKRGKSPDIEKVRLVLKYANDLNKSTALHNYVRMNESHDVNIINLFFEHGTNPNIIDGYNSLRDLCTAKHPNLPLIKLFLENRADPNITDEGINCLGMACLNKDPNPELIKLLLHYKADPNIEDKMGTSCLGYVLRKKEPNLQVIQLLIEGGIRPEGLRDYHCCEKLMDLAIKHNHYTIGLAVICSSLDDKDNTFYLNKSECCKSDGHPLEKLVFCISNHKQPQEIVNFIKQRLEHVENHVDLKKDCEKLSKEDQSVVLSWLLSAKRINMKQKPVQLFIAKEAVDFSGIGELNIINDALEAFGTTSRNQNTKK